jgi:hypothetical protein
MFDPQSRYAKVPTSSLEVKGADGKTRTVTYVRRRPMPLPHQGIVAASHFLVSGDRPDRLAARYLADPQAYWRLCDAEGAIEPDSITEPLGRRLDIRMPDPTGGLA